MKRELNRILSILQGKRCEVSDFDWYYTLGFLILNRIAIPFYHAASENKIELPKSVQAFLETLNEQQIQRNNIMEHWIADVSYELKGMKAPYAFLKGSVLSYCTFGGRYVYITKLKHGNTTYDFTYDGYGRIKTVKAGGVTILTNTYTDFGKNLGGVSGAVSSVTSKDAMDNTVTTYTDKYGKVIATRQNNDLNENEYDAADNLIKHVDSDNNIEYNYEYNEQGDVTKYYEGDSESSAHVRVYNTYDYYNRPLKSTYNVNGKNYSYECEYTEYPDEMLDGFTTPLGEVTYTRDALTRLTQKTVAAKNKTFTETYAYLANLSNSNYTTQLVRELNFNSGVGGVKTLSYTYDANGNIKTVKEGSSEVASYEYDGLNRLTRENIAGEKTVVYTYDAGGNLKTKKEYAYTKSATLGTVKDTFNYTYASGTWGDRLTKYDVGSIQYNEAGYPTMYRGHVLSWEKGNLQYFDNTDFIYNDSGIRIAKGSTDYFVKGNQILAEKRGSTVIHYYYDENGVAGFEYGGQKYYYRKNLQGDIIGIYDSCGNLLGEYKYDAWGNILSQGGSNILTINPFRYRGYYYDEETGLYYLNSRYYDPETGRFISPDDVDVLSDTLTQPNGLNLYAYCYNNPVGYTDIFGHIPVANAFYKIYQSTLIFGFDSKWWGRINYSVSVPIKQTEEAGIFYSFSALRRTDNVIEGGAGINLWGWFGIEVGYNSGGNLYFSMNVTPWLSSGVSFGADGLTCTLGFNDGKVTHEVNFGIGWGLVILVGGVAAVVLSGGQLLSPVLQFFQKLFA